MSKRRKEKNMKKDEEIVTLKFRCPKNKRAETFPIITSALNSLPNEVKKYILIKHPITFSAEFRDFRANAYTLNKRDFGEAEHLIHLNYHVWDFEKKEIERIIIHEIAHIYLGHLATMDDNWQKNEKMEKEADELTAKWIG